MLTSRRTVVAALALVAALAVAGCSSDSGNDNAGASTNTTTGGTGASTASSSTTSKPASAPCAPGSAYKPGTTTQHLTVAGKDREFLVHLPPEPKADMPLVVDFHGANSNMQQQAIYSGFDPIADREGFVVATPNGVDAAVRQWHFLGTQDDVDFAVAIVDELVKNACVDAQRVYATGISSGGAMTASLACQASDTFHGFGPVAADFYVPQICDKATPRPIIIFHGTDDPIVPYNGGKVLTGGTPVQPAEESAQKWATHNGCTSGPKETTLSAEVVQLDWSGCKEPVVMYRIVGGGHTWPGATVDVTRLGATTHQLKASEDMWKFWNGEP
jgi:polyhydroxybutyrate depolymerase